MQSTRRKIGRPRKAPAKVKRATFGFRVTDRMRDQLSAAAAAEGRSISEEIEHRLARSFHEDLLIGDNLHLRLICQDVSNALRILEMMTGRRAFGPRADPWVHQQVENAFADWFDHTRPRGEAKPPEIPGLETGPHSVGEFFQVLVDELNRRELLTGDAGPGENDPATQAYFDRTRELFREILRLWTPKGTTEDARD